MDKVCFGIDIGGTAVKAGLFNTEGKLLHKWEFATRKTEDGKDILKDSAEFIKEKITRSTRGNAEEYFRGSLMSAVPVFVLALPAF
jgi:predicted NBD/HSP70 family sugar kinase